MEKLLVLLLMVLIPMVLVGKSNDLNGYVTSYNANIGSVASGTIIGTNLNIGVVTR